MAVRKPTTTYPYSVTSATAATGSSGSIVLRDYDYSGLVFNLTASSLGGTTPTLDVWVQAQGPDGNFYDMVRFPRLSSTGVISWAAASINANASIGLVTANATSISSTAGGTGVPLLSQAIQFVWGLNGTSPTATFTIQALETDSSRGAE